MRSTVVLFYLFIFISGCGKKQNIQEELAKNILQIKINVSEYQSKEIFFAIQSSEKIAATNIGRVFARRVGDEKTFSFIVVPYREIYPGETLKPMTLIHQRTIGDFIDDFVFVQ